MLPADLRRLEVGSGELDEVVGDSLGAVARADEVDRPQQGVLGRAPVVARVELIIRDGEIDATLVDLAGGQRRAQGQPRAGRERASPASEIRQANLAADRQDTAL